MDRAAIRRYIPLFLFVGLVIIAVIYLIGVANGGSDVLEASGTVEAVSVLVGPEAPGRVMEVYVEEGDYVEQGELLFSLDDEILRVQRVRIIDAGNAAVTAANLQLLMVQQALDDLYEDWPLAAAQAELELAHAQDALDDVVYVHDVRQEGKRASKDTIDAAEANLILAENEVDRAQGAYDSLSGRSEDDSARASNSYGVPDPEEDTSADHHPHTHHCDMKKVEIAGKLCCYLGVFALRTGLRICCHFGSPSKSLASEHGYVR